MLARKHLLPIAAFLVMASCTPVEDFAAYWDKGFADPALEGRWKKTGLPGEPINSIPGSDQLLFTKDGTSYSMYMINPIDSTLSEAQVERRKRDNEAPIETRTLKIGNHLFMMTRFAPGGKGQLERYEIKGDVLTEYVINNGAAVDLLETKYPTAKNIKKNRGEGSYVAIETFDDEAFQILSEIADDEAYWVPESLYEKMP